MELRNTLLHKKHTPASFDPKLRDYQNQDVGFLTSLKAKGVFNQQRVGKTPVTLVCLREMKQNKNIIVAPGSVTFQWLQEYKKWHSDNVKVLTSKLSSKERKEIIKTFTGTLIMSYGILRNHIDDLLKQQYDAMVVDEAHRLRNYKNMRDPRTPKMAKAVIKLGKATPNRYALSGTPSPNKPENIFGILAFLFPDIFTSYWNFIDYYFEVKDIVINRDFDTIKQVTGFKNKNKERELQEFLETISIQRKRKEVMPWLTEIKHEVISLEPTPKQGKYLEELRETFEIEEEELTTLNILERMIRERQIAIEPKLLGLNTKGVKTEWIKEYVADYPEKSIIIVSTFTSYLNYLKKEILTDAVLLTGKVKDEQRGVIEEDFNNKKFNILLANLDVAKEGMKLYGADTMIFIDTSLTYTDNEQCMDRVLPTTEDIASEKDLQEILILVTNTQIDLYLQNMFKEKKSKTDIINDYKRFLLRPVR